MEGPDIHVKVSFGWMGSCKAYMYADTKDAVVANLLVKEEYRGRGVATRLLARVESMAKEWGARRWWLWVDKDAWMHDWYQRKGFVDAHDFLEGTNYIWMVKDI